MKEIDKIKIYVKHSFLPDGRTLCTYTVDVYSKYSKFTTQNYATAVFVGGAGGVHIEYKDNPNRNSLAPIVTGYYEARKFYKPNPHEAAESSFYGAYFWESNIRTGINGDKL
jgi:hypothetical protein